MKFEAVHQSAIYHTSSQIRLILSTALTSANFPSSPNLLCKAALMLMSHFCSNVINAKECLICVFYHTPQLNEMILGPAEWFIHGFILSIISNVSCFVVTQKSVPLTCL